MHQRRAGPPRCGEQVEWLLFLLFDPSPSDGGLVALKDGAQLIMQSESAGGALLGLATKLGRGHGRRRRDAQHVAYGRSVGPPPVGGVGLPDVVTLSSSIEMVGCGGSESKMSALGVRAGSQDTSISLVRIFLGLALALLFQRPETREGSTAARRDVTLQYGISNGTHDVSLQILLEGGTTMALRVLTARQPAARLTAGSGRCEFRARDWQGSSKLQARQ